MTLDDLRDRPYLVAMIIGVVLLAFVLWRVHLLRWILGVAIAVAVLR